MADAIDSGRFNRNTALDKIPLVVARRAEGLEALFSSVPFVFRTTVGAVVVVGVVGVVLDEDDPPPGARLLLRIELTTGCELARNLEVGLSRLLLLLPLLLLLLLLLPLLSPLRYNNMDSRFPITADKGRSLLSAVILLPFPPLPLLLLLGDDDDDDDETPIACCPFRVPDPGELGPVILDADSDREGGFREMLIWPTVVCDPELGLIGGAVMGRLQNMSLTRSSSVFQCGTHRVYSNGIYTSFFSTILPRVTDDSKKGPSQ